MNDEGKVEKNRFDVLKTRPALGLISPDPGLLLRTPVRTPVSALIPSSRTLPEQLECGQICFTKWNIDVFHLVIEVRVAQPIRQVMMTAPLRSSARSTA